MVSVVFGPPASERIAPDGFASAPVMRIGAGAPGDGSAGALHDQGVAARVLPAAFCTVAGLCAPRLRLEPAT